MFQFATHIYITGNHDVSEKFLSTEKDSRGVLGLDCNFNFNNSACEDKAKNAIMSGMDIDEDELKSPFGTLLLLVINTYYFTYL